jgi:cell division transport system permease protein
MKQWLQQHQQALQLVLRRLASNKLATLLMLCVMGVALSLPGMLYITIDNLKRLAGNVQGEPQISLFLKMDISKDTLGVLDKKLAQHTGIKQYRFVGKDEAWREIQQNTTTTSITSNLEKNPLPDAYFVTPKQLDPERIAELQAEMQQWQGVEVAQTDANWIKRLHALLELGKIATWLVTALLAFALITIIGNTIRLQILTQHEEIEVSKLIGATDSFIRRPFLYAGTIYGLGGGLTAWLFLASTVYLFNRSVEELAQLYASDFRLTMPDAFVTICMLGSALLLGWLGSYIAVGRSLRKFNPH